MLHAIDDLGPSYEAEIMHRHEAAGMLRASGEGYLEFSSEVLGVRMTEEKTHAGSRVWRDVKNFVSTDAGQRTGGDVSDGVATGLPCGDTDRRQSTH